MGEGRWAGEDPQGGASPCHWLGCCPTPGTLWGGYLNVKLPNPRGPQDQPFLSWGDSTEDHRACWVVLVLQAWAEAEPISTGASIPASNTMNGSHKCPGRVGMP